MMTNKSVKVAFLASGGGSNFQAILDKINSGELAHIEPVLLLTNNSKCGAVAKAQAAQVPVVHISGLTHGANQDAAMVAALQNAQAEWIVLAGFMKKIPAGVLQHWENRILNIHPALLPAFGGAGMWGHHVHEAVVAAGVRVSGPTVHFVNEVYDAGAIIAQKAVALTAADTPEIVGQKVLAAEHDLYWRALRAVVSGAVQIRQGKVYGDVQT